MRLDATTLVVLGRAEGMRFPLKLTDQGLIGLGSDVGLMRVNPATGELIEPLSSGSARIKIATVSRNGHQIAAIDHNGNLLALGAREPQIVSRGLMMYYLVTLDSTGTRLWMTNTGRDFRCLSWPEGRTIWTQRLPAVAPWFVMASNDTHLIIALENGSLEVRDSASGMLLRQIDSGSAAPQALAISPDGARLFAMGNEAALHCFDTSLWDEVHALSLGSNVRPHALAVSADGKTIACLTKTGELRILRTE